MGLIKGYLPKVWPINAQTIDGGYNCETDKFTVFERFSDPLTAVERVLDAITAAVESGYIDQEKWVSQVFANEKIFLEFIELYSNQEYDLYRTHDRWLMALRQIADWHDDEGFVLSDDIAAKLVEQARETGQIS